jgi:hypothetical protein
LNQFEFESITFFVRNVKDFSPIFPQSEYKIKVYPAWKLDLNFFSILESALELNSHVVDFASHKLNWLEEFLKLTNIPYYRVHEEFLNQKDIFVPHTLLGKIRIVKANFFDLRSTNRHLEVSEPENGFREHLENLISDIR